MSSQIRSSRCLAKLHNHINSTNHAPPMSNVEEGGLTRVYAVAVRIKQSTTVLTGIGHNELDTTPTPLGLVLAVLGVAHTP